MSTQNTTLRGASGTSQHVSDASLLQHVQQGDKGALSDLYQRYERPLTEFLSRMLNDREAAQDLKQEVFIKVLLHAHSFKGNAKVSTWLFAIAKNCCLSYLRHRKVVDQRIQREPREEQDNTWLERVAAQQANPEEEMQTKEEFAQVSKRIKALRHDQQQVLVMREAFDYTHNEIATQLGCPENTVKTRTFRALGHLRKALGIKKLAA
jgi:RNA polymerase sigma-70 factor, ECF subfamily